MKPISEFDKPDRHEVLLLCNGEWMIGYRKNNKFFIVNNGDYHYGGYGRDYEISEDSEVYNYPAAFHSLPSDL